MVITAGLGSVEDAEKLILSGAKELFCGFVPVSWNQRYSNVLPLNRREVLFYHVNICTLEDMRILYKIASKYDVSVSVAFNSLYYTAEQLPVILGYIRELTEIGYSSFIMSDINLIRYLSAQDIRCDIHLSGEIGEINTYTLQFLKEHIFSDNCRLSRVIFHRKMSFKDMKRIIEFSSAQGYGLQFEAFYLNEKCHYTGGFCSSIHCDEMVHICQLEYKLDADCCVESSDMYQKDAYVYGQSGCGLCSINELKEIGIEYLKIVGRGASSEQMEEDIKITRMALEIDETELRRKTIFPKECSKNCYYCYE